MTKMKLILPGLTLFLLMLVTSPFIARAEERVLSFDVTAALQSDGAMIVTERIRVNIEQKVIRHGITHAYPIKEVYDGRKLRHYGYELLSVKLDDKKVNYYQNNRGYAVGIAIGKSGVGAPLGEHAYEIAFKTSGHVRPMKDRDEIYYNVMGNNWEFPVDRISFTLQLPGGDADAFIETVAYTGGLGESGKDYELDGKQTVRTTRTLKPGEGLTVAMAWKKGLVTLPEESFANIMGAYRTQLLLGIFVVMLAYFATVRFAYSLGPKGVVVPLFSPQEGMSPGYMAVLKSMAFQGRMLHADIIWAAVNGFLRLDARDKKKILLRRLDIWEEPERMKSGGQWAREKCKKVTDDLLHISKFRGSLEELDLRSREGRERAERAFEYRKMKYESQEGYLWKRSFIPAIPGALLFVVLYCWVTHYIDSPALYKYDSVYEYLAITGFLFGLAGMFVYGLRMAVRMFDGLRRVACLILAPLAVIAILVAVWTISSEDYFFLGMYAATLGVTAWGIAHPPGRRTPEGRKEYLKVQGLEMYIRTAETDRLAKLNAPEDTVEKFEELLPYAVALGCAKAWQKRFDKVLLAEDYAPQWVAADDHAATYKTAFAAVTGFGGMAAAANAARAASDAARLSTSFSGPGSSSGGSTGGASGFGGGSSGGGSGGTRVGGW